MYNIEKKKIVRRGSLFRYFSWGLSVSMRLFKFYLGTHKSGNYEKMPSTSLFHAPRLPCLNYNDGPLLKRCTTDCPEFLLFHNWKIVFCLKGSSLKMETMKIELNTVKISIFFTLVWIEWGVKDLGKFFIISYIHVLLTLRRFTVSLYLELLSFPLPAYYTISPFCT